MENQHYLYLAPFKNSDEFKFGWGVDPDDFPRVRKHHRLKPIDLLDTYFITGDKRSILKLEGVLKTDYSTQEFILPEAEMKEKYSDFLNDGYTEIRRKACFQMMLDHVAFKQTRPGMKLGELKKGITFPNQPKKPKLINRKLADPIDYHKINKAQFDRWLPKRNEFFKTLKEGANEILEWDTQKMKKEDQEGFVICLRIRCMLARKITPFEKEKTQEELNNFLFVNLRMPDGNSNWSMAPSMILDQEKDQALIRFITRKDDLLFGDYGLRVLSWFYDSIVKGWNQILEEIPNKKSTSGMLMNELGLQIKQLRQQSEYEFI